MRSSSDTRHWPEDEGIDFYRLNVAAAMVGAAAIGAVGSSVASSNAEDAQNNATDAASKSAANSAQLGQEQLDFSKQQYADTKDARDKALVTSQQAAEAQLAAQNQQTQIAADYDAYNKGTFRPLEQGIVSDAQNYDTPEKRQAAADAAMADVNQGFSATNAANARSLAANGVDPGSARAMSVRSGQDIAQATANAGAAYRARQGVQSVGTAMKMDAASLGRNLPSNQTAAANSAIQAGNSATGSAATGVNAATAGVGNVNAGYSGAIGANLGAGGIYTNAASIAQRGAAGDAAAWQSLGSTVGRGIQAYNAAPVSSPLVVDPYVYNMGSDGAGGYYSNEGLNSSDENVKEDIKPADADAALAQVVDTPVKRWKYNPAAMAARGLPMDDGAEHTGAMAQEVNRTMGERAAPGGTKIDTITIAGKTMLAVQALDKRVNKLAKLISAGHIQARAA